MVNINKLFIIILFFYCILNILNKNKQIINSEININDITYLSKLKKVVYTILLGKNDNIHPIIKEKGYDYFMLTDQNIKNNSETNWTIINVDINKKYKSKKEKIKRQRFYKTHPHLFFKNYDLSIYIDAKYAIKGNLDEFLLRILTPKYYIYLLEHPNRSTINNELKAVAYFQKESRNLTRIIKKRYNEENFPDNNGLAETSIIVRKHNDLNCIDFMTQWYEEIKLYSHRDQLSFNYIYWKTRYKYVKYIPKKYTTEYFTQHDHIIKDIIK